MRRSYESHAASGKQTSCDSSDSSDSLKESRGSRSSTSRGPVGNPAKDAPSVSRALVIALR